jgi:hypothetical protein
MSVTEIDLQHLLGSLNTFTLLWPIVGNDLPPAVQEAISAELERMGPPADWSQTTSEHSERLLLSRAGLLAAYYHRDRIASIERAVIDRVRDASPPDLLPGASASVRMPVISHEFVAYLLAARRTLDYLARGVATCFDRPRAYRITKLVSTLADARPRRLAAEVAELCADVSARFPHLLSHEDSLSDRDRAAHYWPIEPAHLLIVHFPDGGLGIEFRDDGEGYLRTPNELDPGRMLKDDLLLTKAIDTQLADLGSFVTQLLAIGVDASLAGRTAA